MVSENRQFPWDRDVMLLFCLVFLFFLLVAVRMFEISGNNSSVSLFLFSFQARGNTVWRRWVLRLCLISSTTPGLTGSSLNRDLDVLMHGDCSSVPSILHSSAAATQAECFKTVTQLSLAQYLWWYFWKSQEEIFSPCDNWASWFSVRNTLMLTGD